MKRMKNILKVATVLGLLIGGEGVGFAQGTQEIPDHEVMWKKNYTRVIDMREKQNASWMSYGNEISRHLIDGVMSGKLTGYKSDSLTSVMKIEDFVSKMTIPGTEVEPTDPEWDTNEEEWPDMEIEGDFGPVEPMGPQMFLPKQMYILQINEDAIYSRKESRMRYKIKTISMYIPADVPENLRGVQDHVITFKYEDCVKYFEGLNQWVWFNRSNTQEHKGFENAMDLRLFASTIVKVSNPDNLYIEDIEGSPEKGIYGSQREMFNLMETEHEMYEY